VHQYTAVDIVKPCCGDELDRVVQLGRCNTAAAKARREKSQFNSDHKESSLLFSATDIPSVAAVDCCPAKPHLATVIQTRGRQCEGGSSHFDVRRFPSQSFYRIFCQAPRKPPTGYRLCRVPPFLITSPESIRGQVRCSTGRSHFPSWLCRRSGSLTATASPRSVALSRGRIRLSQCLNSFRQYGFSVPAGLAPVS